MCPTSTVFGMFVNDGNIKQVYSLQVFESCKNFSEIKFWNDSLDTSRF